MKTKNVIPNQTVQIIFNGKNITENSYQKSIKYKLV